MLDSEKTREQLISELEDLRHQLEKLKSSGDAGNQTTTKSNPPEDKFYKAFLSSPDMIIISSIPDGRYLEVNDAYCQNTGYSREELINHYGREFNLFATQDEYERMMRLLKEKGGFKGEEFSFRVRSGEIRQWICSAETVNWNEENCMIAVAVDITEQKKMRQALNETEQILAIAFHASPQAIAITTLKDSKFIELNHSHEILTGYSREESIGRTPLELNLWVNLEERERILQLLKTKGRFHEELVSFRDKSGKIHTVLFSAEIITIRGESCIIGSSTDLTEREKIAQALRVSEEKFTIAFNSNPTAMCLTTLNEGKFIEVNDSFLNFTGYSREEIIGNTPDSLSFWVSPEEREAMNKSLQETGGITNQKIRSRMKNGEVRTGLFSGRSIDIGHEKYLIITIADVTERAKAEEAIANEAILKRILINDSRDGIVILDNDGKVFEANRRFCEMLGYTPEEANNLYVWDWDTQWDKENLLGQIRAVTEKGDHFETSHRRKDGAIIDVEISTNGAIIGGKKLVFCVCRDITRRKQMEKALRESEEKFSKAFHASPEITAITTVKDGIYIDINENYTLVTGYTREELIGHSALSLGIWANPEERKDMFRTLEKDGRISKKEYKFKTKSGEIRTWLFSAEQITIGEEPCLLGASIDITDQKLIEAKALEAESLREIDKLRRELLSNVSHELRTPLAGIKGFTTMLMDYGKRLKPAEKQEYLETIDKNADRLSELIEQLLEMSRLGAGMITIKKKPADIAALCRSVIKDAALRAPDHKFRLDIPRRLPRIEIDEKRIRQVFDNILDNSIKYSLAGTEIIISVRKRENDLLFSIADQGRGIRKEDLPHIFERAFAGKVKSNQGNFGAGLGLSICKGLIEAHDGKIWIESEEGAGTKCFFTLPLKPQPNIDDSSDAVSQARARAILS